MNSDGIRDDAFGDSLPHRPRASLWTWYQAWREVIRDPHKTIPEPHLFAEGKPIPPEYDLHCPECGASISGLCEWTCPQCHERFSPRRAYTLRMLKEPEYFLRYRFSPADLRMILCTIFLLLAGAILAVVAGARYMVTISFVSSTSAPITLGIKTLAWVAGTAAPSLVLLKYTRDIPWFRVAFYYSLIWFLTAAGIVIAKIL